MSKKTHISSSGSFLSAFLAIHWKAASTLNPSFAEVSKYGMFPLEAHHALAFFSETCNQKQKTIFMLNFARTATNILPSTKREPYYSKLLNSKNASHRGQEKSMSTGKTTHHPAIPTINIYLVPQHNKWEVFRVRRTGLNIKYTKHNYPSHFSWTLELYGLPIG